MFPRTALLAACLALAACGDKEKDAPPTSTTPAPTTRAKLDHDCRIRLASIPPPVESADPRVQASQAAAKIGPLEATSTLLRARGRRAGDQQLLVLAGRIDVLLGTSRQLAGTRPADSHALQTRADRQTRALRKAAHGIGLAGCAPG
jgi:hypothetical protein